MYKDYESSEDKILPEIKENEVLKTTAVEKEQHFTKPPARYTEAKLIKEMEELGIGRPSTYAKTMDTLKSRGYVEIIDKKFIPTAIGVEITEKLQESFSQIINVEYTAKMETDLDKISEGNAVWNDVLEKFYKKFEPTVKEAFEKIPKKEAVKTGDDCPTCGSPLVIRKGKYGAFVGCSNYPKCKYIKQDEKEIKEIIKCPTCDGMIIEKKSRKGKVFYGCSSYPKCNTAYWDIPTGKLCPECNSMLVNKKDKTKCINCDYQE